MRVHDRKGRILGVCCIRSRVFANAQKIQAIIKWSGAKNIRGNKFSWADNIL